MPELGCHKLGHLYFPNINGEIGFGVQVSPKGAILKEK